MHAESALQGATPARGWGARHRIRPHLDVVEVAWVDRRRADAHENLAPVELLRGREGQRTLSGKMMPLLSPSDRCPVRPAAPHPFPHCGAAAAISDEGAAHPRDLLGLDLDDVSGLPERLHSRLHRSAARPPTVSTARVLEETREHAQVTGFRPTWYARMLGRGTRS